MFYELLHRFVSLFLSLYIYIYIFIYIYVYIYRYLFIYLVSVFFDLDIFKLFFSCERPASTSVGVLDVPGAQVGPPPAGCGSPIPPHASVVSSPTFHYAATKGQISPTKKEKG